MANHLPATMRALRQPSLTGPRDLHLITDAPVPAPGPGEVLIRVGAAGVNFADVMQAYGTYDGGPRTPYIAGFEAAGEIVAVGPGVTGLSLGARVIGTGYGAFAEYMVLPASGATPVPAGWADEQALGLVLNWATALAALRPLGRVTAGETVLIHAAAGGVGQAAVRLAKHYGATVIAVASPPKHTALRTLGADAVISDHTLTNRGANDHTIGDDRSVGGRAVDEDHAAGNHGHGDRGADNRADDRAVGDRAFGDGHAVGARSLGDRAGGERGVGERGVGVRGGGDYAVGDGGAGLTGEVLRLTGGRGADLVLESAGGETFRASLAAAKRVTGRVVVYGAAGGEATISNWELIFRHQVEVIGLHIGALIETAPELYADLMAELSALIAAGVYPPGQPTTYDLADGPKALAELEARATSGKLALRP